MNCIYQSYSDGGAELRKLISDYQDLLIDERILKDDSPKSYKSIFEKISNDGKIVVAPSKYFINEIRGIGQPDASKLQKCHLNIIADSAQYDSSKLKQFENIFSADNHKNYRVPTVAKQILDVLSIEDYTLDLYKLRTFLIFSFIETDAGLLENSSKFKSSELDSIALKNALRIEIDGNNQIYVDNKKASSLEFQRQVNSYMKKYTSDAIICMKTDRKTKYKIYNDTYNTIVSEVQRLRESLSKKLYNADLDSLSEIQLSEIKKTYPLNFIETQ